MYATKWMALYGKHDQELVKRFFSFPLLYLTSVL
jgi:hypothetical protein